MKGLPPLFIQASTIEVLLDDSRRVVEKAQHEGVDVLFKAWPGLPHVWQVFTPLIPEARAALREASAFIRLATELNGRGRWIYRVVWAPNSSARSG